MPTRSMILKRACPAASRCVHCLAMWTPIMPFESPKFRHWQPQSRSRWLQNRHLHFMPAMHRRLDWLGLAQHRSESLWVCSALDVSWGTYRKFVSQVCHVQFECINDFVMTVPSTRYFHAICGTSSYADHILKQRVLEAWNRLQFEASKNITSTG